MNRHTKHPSSTLPCWAPARRKKSLTIGAALLQNIQDNPHDDALRLRLADWLEHQGDTDRAEFVRVQLALADMSKDNPARRSLKRCQAQLLEQHQESWLGPFSGMKSLKCVYQRGLLEVEIDGQDFSDDHVQALAGHPAWEWVMKFGIEYVEEAWFPNILNSRLLREVTHLTIATDEALCALSNCHTLTRLRHLTAEETDLTDSGIESLAAAPFLNQLTSLDLGYHDECFEVKELAVLLAGIKLARLDSLKLQCNMLMDDGAEALANCSHLANLKHLDLSYTYIRNAGAKALARSPYLARIERLILDENIIGPKGVKELQLRFGALVTCAKQEEDD